MKNSQEMLKTRWLLLKTDESNLPVVMQRHCGAFTMGEFQVFRLIYHFFIGNLAQGLVPKVT